MSGGAEKVKQLLADYPVEQLLPHSGDMVLLDEIVSCDQQQLTARVTVREESLFLSNGQLPSWVGIEFMAQAVSAWSGVQRRLQNLDVSLGYLLGSRKYQSRQAFFQLGECLKIVVTRTFSDGELGVFHCTIDSERSHVEAAINVFQPMDT